MKRLLSAVFLISMLALAGGAATLPVNFDRRATIAVTGQGEVQVTPDIASVDFEVTQESAVLPPAVEAVRAAMKRIFDVLRSDGVADKDIQTQAYNVSPKIEWDNGKSRNVGYIVTDRIKVTIRNLNQAGQILADAVAAGANQVNSLQFNVENKGKAEALALAKAVENAKAKAMAIAQASGMELGKPIFFSESSYYQPPIRQFMGMAKAATPAVPEPEPVNPGQETISATIQATFLMVSK